VNGAENTLPQNPQNDAIATDFSATATSSDANSATVEGKVSFIGPYRLLTKLGEGGMGSVWLAEQTAPVKRQVAIKVIKAGIVSGKAFQRFDLERQTLAMMDHPAIAKVFDAGSTEDGNPFLVMEYVSGLPLTTYCNQKRLGTRERIELMITVCKGVQHAHQKAIMHRDLKPSNILVTEVDGKPVPRIIDFGIAKATQSTDIEAATLDVFTQMGGTVGTWGYMSPEQADPRVLDVDTRTDVYSLGVVLFELLTASLPFDIKGWKAKPLHEVLRQLHEEDPPRPSTRVSTGSTAAAENSGTDAYKLVSQLRGDLDWITLKALERERERRYSSPADLAADLSRYLNDDAVTARPPTVTYRVGKFVRRNRLAVAFTAVLVVVMIGFAVSMTVARNRARREAEASKRVSDFMISMFRVSDPSESRGNAVTARELLDKAAADIEKGLGKDERVQARLMQTMAKTYIGLGLFDQARGLLERTVAIQTRLLSSDDPETMESMSLLGHAYEAVGRYPDAEKLLRQTLAAQQRVLGPDNEQTMSTMGLLSDTLSLEGNYAVAEDIVRRTLQSQQRVLGPESRAAMRSMRTLTGNLSNQQRYTDAEQVGRETLALEQRVSGPNDPGTIWSMNMLGYILDQEHNYSQAEKLLRETLEISNRVLGPEHSSTQMTLSTLGGVVRDEGRLAEAEALQRTALERTIKTNGPQGPATLLAMGYLATTLQKEQKFAEAEKLSRQILEAYAETLGPTAPLTLTAMQKLAAMLAYAKRSAEAELLFQKAVSSVAKTDPSQLGAALYSYGAGMAVLGHPDEAILRLQQAVEHGFVDVDQMAADDDLKPLRGDSRFQALLAQVRKAHASAQ
jgi:non-specific serine/threonine protein kinase/serine/threonine-protein kinase